MRSWLYAMIGWLATGRYAVLVVVLVIATAATWTLDLGQSLAVHAAFLALFVLGMLRGVARAEPPPPRVPVRVQQEPSGVVRAALSGLHVEVHRPADDPSQIEIRLDGDGSGSVVRVPADQLEDVDAFGAMLLLDAIVELGTETLLDASAASLGDQR